MESRELLAVMGPSGCGKTTLLNIFAGRLSTLNDGRVGGVLSFGSKGGGDSCLLSTRAIAYVLQEDEFFSHLTVRETLLISCHFRLSTEVSIREKVGIVNTLLSGLGLTEIQDNFVGSSTRRGISGGERKRLSIATQLVSLPKLFILDEPTSGLDSFQAQRVIEAMKYVTGKGSIVIASIHQPSSTIFDMFDKLLLISEGKTVFNGPATDSVDYFSNLGFVCPIHHNPADFFLDLISIDSSSQESITTCSSRISNLTETWKNHENIHLQESLRVIASNEPMPIHQNAFTFSFRKWYTDFLILVFRAFMNKYRDFWGIAFQIFPTLFLAVLISLIFRDLGYEQRSIQDRTGVLFFICVSQVSY